MFACDSGLDIMAADNTEATSEDMNHLYSCSQWCKRMSPELVFDYHSNLAFTGPYSAIRVGHYAGIAGWRRKNETYIHVMYRMYMLFFSAAPPCIYTVSQKVAHYI